MRGSAGSSPSARLPAGRRDAVVVEHVADPNGRTETQLGMAFAEVLGHRRRLGVADAVHQQEYRAAAQARDLKPGAAVEHPSRLHGGWA